MTAKWKENIYDGSNMNWDSTIYVTHSHKNLAESWKEQITQGNGKNSKLASQY